MFNPWKQAKERREAQKFADMYFEALKATGKWFEQAEHALAEQTNEEFFNGQDADNNVYYFAKTVNKLYNVIEANRDEFLTQLESDIANKLNAIVDAKKDTSLTELLNQPIAVRCSQEGNLVMPLAIKYCDLGNGMVRIGPDTTVA
jgi:deoxyhypusine synthase